jgi:hypothetical protein
MGFSVGWPLNAGRRQIRRAPVVTAVMKVCGQPEKASVNRLKLRGQCRPVKPGPANPHNASVDYPCLKD